MNESKFWIEIIKENKWTQNVQYLFYNRIYYIHRRWWENTNWTRTVLNWIELNGSGACDFLYVFLYLPLFATIWNFCFSVLAFNITAPLVYLWVKDWEPNIEKMYTYWATNEMLSFFYSDFFSAHFDIYGVILWKNWSVI